MGVWTTSLGLDHTYPCVHNLGEPDDDVGGDDGHDDNLLGSYKDTYLMVIMTTYLVVMKTTYLMVMMTTYFLSTLKMAIFVDFYIETETNLIFSVLNSVQG